jgi:hypothetical protein
MSQFSEHEPHPGLAGGHFREAAVAPGVSPLGRGMVGHVPIVAMLMVVQGVLEIAFGAMCLFFAAIMQWTPDEDLDQVRNLVPFIVVFSIPALVCGALRIVAGCFNYFFRRRMLGMVALAFGLFTMMTAYCAPTSIALAIYGLIVLFSESVIAAFDMARRGHSVAEINAAFPRMR